ncbi:MAG: hypothetical protein IKG98_11520 [Ruminococcus sp.]|nr:hypothetical protein [Ruminococcus sp.]
MSTIKMTVEVSAETAWKIIDLMTAEEAIAANKSQSMAPPAPQQPITAVQQFGAAPIPTPASMPAPVSTATAAQQFSAPVQNTPVYNAAPTAAPAPAPAAVIPSNAPTSAPMYSIAQLQTACGPLADSGKLPELQKLIASFGVNSLAELPQARYGEFANGLRALGGVL